MIFSIIYITCRNSFDILKSNLDRQSLREFEIIIVDNWPKPRNNLIDNLLASYNYQYIWMPRTYTCIASSFNKGLLYANGQYIFYLNDNVILPVNTLKAHYNTYRKYGNKIIVHGLCNIMNSKGEIIGHKPPFLKLDKQLDEYTYISTGERYCCGVNDSSPLEAALDVNGLDEEFDGALEGHDPDFGLRMELASYRCLFINNVVTTELEHPKLDIKEIKPRTLNINLKLHKESFCKSYKEGIVATNRINLRETRNVKNLHR